MRISTRSSPVPAIRLVALLDNGEQVSVEFDDEIILPPGHGCRSISIWPSGDYWPAIVFEVFPEVVYLEPIQGAAAPWWMVAVQAGLAKSTDGQGLRVGIVDGPIDSMIGLARLRMVSVTEGPVGLAPKDSWTHAREVALIIGGDGEMGSQLGMAPGADLLHADVSAFPLGGSADDWDNQRIADAVTTLAIDHQADIINISGGSFFQPTVFHGRDRVLDVAVETANEKGAICIAGVGNNGCPPVGLPAGCPGAVGVGAFGSCEISLPATFNHYIECEARKKDWVHRDDLRYYSSSANSFGEGLDLVAPGVGVTVALDGGRLCPVYGSSFAAPIVTGALAAALAHDQRYLDLEGRARSDYAMIRLWSMCRGGDMGEWIGRGRLSVAS